MSRRLCIGITGLTPGWRTILDQIGSWYEELNEIPISSESHSLLIINKPLSTDDEKAVHSFLSSGGAALETTKASGTSTTSNRLVRVYNDNSLSFLSHIPFLDIYFDKKDCSFSDLFNLVTTDCGHTCKLQFNPDELIQESSYTRKRFFFKPGAHPDELASKITKHELSEFIGSIIKELHFRQNLPFVCKWTSPKEEPVFAFRIDSDFGNQQSVKELYSIGKESEIPMTWFLHVEAHEEWLSVFKGFEGQEIALHGYEHGTSSSYEHVINNIERGLQKLRDEGFDPKGFCAPYAIWNSTLEEVLQQFAFEYTSEFTLGYDGLPFHPNMNSAELPLQIPIHPICTGSLSRMRISEKDMGGYFSSVMENKLARYNPVVFYHHPLQPGAFVWKEIFKKVNDLNLTKLSFLEYSEFWKKRNSASFEAHFEEESGNTVIKNSSSGLIYQQSNNHNDFELIQIEDSDRIIKKSTRSYGEVSLPNNDQLKELISSKLRLLKTSILDWRNRKKL